MTTVSVVIPHYGDPVPTMALADQIALQIGPRDQLIVVDDCSPVPLPDLAVATVVHRQANGGFGSACNTGAAQASGTLLLFLNSDLSIGPTFIDDMVKAAAPWQPCVAGPRIIENGEIDEAARLFPTVRHQATEWLAPLTRFRARPALHRAVGHDLSASKSNSDSVTDWLVGAAILVPRTEFVGVGGFDERFHMNSEEVDLQRRLRAHGLPSVHLPAVIVHHAGGGSSDAIHRRKWLVNARLNYAAKWGGLRLLRVGLTLATAVNLLWNTMRRLTGRPINPAKVAAQEIDLIWKRESR